MYYKRLKVELLNVYGVAEALLAMRLPKHSQGDSWLSKIGPKDAALACALINKGDSHAKAMRGQNRQHALYGDACRCSRSRGVGLGTVRQKYYGVSGAE